MYRRRARTSLSYALFAVASNFAIFSVLLEIILSRREAIQFCKGLGIAYSKFKRTYQIVELIAGFDAQGLTCNNFSSPQLFHKPNIAYIASHVRFLNNGRLTCNVRMRRLSKVCPANTAMTRLRPVPSLLTSRCNASQMLVVPSTALHASIGIKLWNHEIPCSAN